MATIDIRTTPLTLVAAAAMAAAACALGGALSQEILTAHADRKDRARTASFYEEWAEDCDADASCSRTHGDHDGAKRHEHDATNLRIAAAMLRNGASRAEAAALVPPPF